MKKFITGTHNIPIRSNTNLLIGSNDVQTRYWDNGELNFPPSKSQGRTVMTSDFVEPIGGVLEYNDAIWAEMKVNTL